MIADAVSVPSPLPAAAQATRSTCTRSCPTGGADAALAASIFHFGEFTVGDAKRYLNEHGVAVRPA